MRKLASLFAIVAGIAAGPVLAQNELIEDMKVIDNCAGEVRRVCQGVEPGEGRIKACLAENVAKVKPACIESLLGAVIATRPAPTIKLKPGQTPGLSVHTDAARDYAYCEIAPVVSGPKGSVIAQFYNTTGTTGPAGGCPPDKFATIDAKELSKKLGAAVTYMNPTPQTARRHWVMDEIWVFVVGETVDFDGVNATWMASMSPRQMLSAMSAPYGPVEIHRKSKYLYKAGSTVFLMRAPHKKVWVMQSYATEVDKELAFDKLPQLGSRLKLPAGWTFEVKKLTKDLTIDPRNANGVAHIVRDDHHNVYEGCGFDKTCNYVP
jgi:hypothetical protein